MERYSLTGVGIVVSVLVFILNYFGFTFEQGSVAQFVENIVQAGGFLMVLYGQYRRGDLKYGLVRR